MISRSEVREVPVPGELLAAMLEGLHMADPFTRFIIESDSEKYFAAAEAFGALVAERGLDKFDLFVVGLVIACAGAHTIRTNAGCVGPVSPPAEC